MKQNERIEGFDLLRGLCALGVVYYHLFKWFNLPVSYTLGLHGVYIFFVLSGASLYVAYANKIRTGFSISNYLGLRFFRLVPLYGLVVLLVPLVDQKPYDFAFWSAALLNISFAFGLANPGVTTLVTGGWSLGIEVAFYLIFPALVFLLANRTAVFVLAAAFVCQTVYVHGLLSSGSIITNWPAYVQILSFIFYFVAGCLIGRFFQTVKWRPAAGVESIGVWAAFLSLLVLIGFGSGATPEATLTGFRGAILAIGCAILVLTAGLLPIQATWLALALGNMSYGVYLLHPILHTLVARYAPNLRDNQIAYATGIAVFSAVVALVLEKYYERPIRRLGGKLFNSRPKALTEAFP